MVGVTESFCNLETRQVKCWSGTASLEYQILVILFERHPRMAERKENNHMCAQVITPLE